MRDNFKLIFATLFVIILTGCGNMTNSSLIINKSSDSSSTYLSSSLSSTVNPDDDYYTKNMDDFNYYLSGIYSAGQIWSWKKVDGHWYSGFPNESSSYPGLSTINRMLEEKACPLSSMKRLIDTYYAEYKLEKNNKIIEIPMISSPSEHRASMDGYPNNISINAYLYESLGLYA